MREWHITANDLRSITLAADARLCTPDYTNDQIWELSLRGGEPPCLSLQTTYGLRARSMRIFPRLIEDNDVCQDPDEFHAPPIIRHFYPNYIQVTFSPLAELEVLAEYWAPGSQVVAGSFQITNHSAVARQVQLECAVLLNPGENGQRMAPQEIQVVQVLCGLSDGLAPVLFLTGGAVAAAGPFPALASGLDLPPGSTRRLVWVLASLETPEASFKLARQTAACRWDAERTRIELTNAGQVEVITGDPDWDSAFALSQKTALSLFVGPTSQLTHASLVMSRQPDHGFSLIGDGSDYSQVWSGQTPLDAYIIATLTLPSEPGLIKGLLMNFLSTQTEDGFVDWRPGLGGQRGNRLATPLLASLAWRIYSADPDINFLAEVYPRLLAYVQSWFSSERDRDGDGVPEWDHPMQSGFDDHPLFARWHIWAQGLDITTAESPSLCSFLFRECQVLIGISQLLERPEALPDLHRWADAMRVAVEASWDESKATYQYWDRDAHTCSTNEFRLIHSGSGDVQIHQAFEKPIRLLFRLQTQRETTRRPLIFIHGVSPSGAHRVERLTADRFLWFLEMGTTTSERTYEVLEHIAIHGVNDGDQLTIQSADFTHQDHTLLLPLWAGLPTRERAGRLIAQTITAPDHYWRSFGLPACPQPPAHPEAEVCCNVHLPWNILIGEGLLEYDHPAEAAQLVTRLMKAIIQSLKTEGSFRRYYQADTGQGTGERDALSGLAPLGLFLETLGVRLISPYRVHLSGDNPFPWPVTIKYRGLTILRQKEKTLVIFPDGQTVSVEDPSPRQIALEDLSRPSSG